MDKLSGTQNACWLFASIQPWHYGFCELTRSICFWNDTRDRFYGTRCILNNWMRFSFPRISIELRVSKAIHSFEQMVPRPSPPKTLKKSGQFIIPSNKNSWKHLCWKKKLLFVDVSAFFLQQRRSSVARIFYYRWVPCQLVLVLWAGSLLARNIPQGLFNFVAPNLYPLIWNMR